MLLVVSQSASAHHSKAVFTPCTYEGLSTNLAVLSTRALFVLDRCAMCINAVIFSRIIFMHHLFPSFDVHACTR